MATPASYTLSLPYKTVVRPNFNSCIFPASSLRFPSPFSSFLTFSLSISHSLDYFSSVTLPSSNRRASEILAVVEEEPMATAEPEEIVSEEEGNDGLSDDLNIQSRSCELYVCNLPRSCEITDLYDIFKPYGTVQSVEISRNSGTGVSRGCGYVLMSSIPEAKSAIIALDGSDLGGRELRVRFSADVFSKKKNTDALNVAPKNVVFESPYKVYVGNLAWSVKPEDLKEYFGQFGTVVSTRILYDRKEGKRRVYGFLSFSSAEECEAAISSSGMDFHGRTLLVREAYKKE